MKRFRSLILLVQILLSLLSAQNAHAIWNPSLGRFMQRDPLGYPNGLNSYAGYHVLNGGLDPSGLDVSPELYSASRLQGMSHANALAHTRRYSDVEVSDGYAAKLEARFRKMYSNRCDPCKTETSMLNRLDRAMEETAFQMAGRRGQVLQQMENNRVTNDHYQGVADATIGMENMAKAVTPGVAGTIVNAPDTIDLIINSLAGDSTDAAIAASIYAKGRTQCKLSTTVPAATSPLSSEIKDILRADARDLWQAKTSRRAIWDGLDIHHRIPLEWSHLFPKADPNRIANLVGMTSDNHTLITNAWNAWRRGLNGRIPTAAEVLQQTIRLDEQFGTAMRFLP